MPKGRRSAAMLEIILSGRWKGALLSRMENPKRGTKKRHKKRVLDDWRRCAEVAACGCEELEEIRETKGFSVRVPLPL